MVVQLPMQPIRSDEALSLRLGSFRRTQRAAVALPCTNQGVPRDQSASVWPTLLCVGCRCKTSTPTSSVAQSNGWSGGGTRTAVLL